MKEITKEEFSKMEFCRGRSLQGRFLTQKLKELDLGSALVVEGSEWNLKTELDSYVGSYFRKERSDKIFVTRRLLDESGWAILRIK